MKRIFPLLFAVLLAGLGTAAHAADAQLERLLAQAEKEAPDEVQLHVIKTTGRLSGFFAKVREVEQVQGWQQIRATGEAAFAAWDNQRKDFVWRSEKFEVLWDIRDGRKLRLNSVTLGGVSQKADP
jgi:hypothetical protein